MMRSGTPDAAVLVYAPCADLALTCDALRAGASGLLQTGFPPNELSRALSLALKGETVVPRKLLAAWLEEQRRTDPKLVLRPRQLEILRLAAEGLTNAQIAQRLHLAESTVKQHLRSAYKQLGVHNRNEAARLLQPASYQTWCLQPRHPWPPSSYESSTTLSYSALLTLVKQRQRRWESSCEEVRLVADQGILRSSQLPLAENRP